MQMANKHMKRHSKVCVIRERVIKTAVRHHCIPIRTAKTWSANRGVEQQEHSFTAGGGAATSEDSLAVSYKTMPTLTHDSAAALLGTDSKELKIQIHTKTGS